MTYFNGYLIFNIGWYTKVMSHSFFDCRKLDLLLSKREIFLKYLQRTFNAPKSIMSFCMQEASSRNNDGKGWGLMIRLHDFYELDTLIRFDMPNKLISFPTPKNCSTFQRIFLKNLPCLYSLFKYFLKSLVFSKTKLNHQQKIRMQSDSQGEEFFYSYIICLLFADSIWVHTITYLMVSICETSASAKKCFFPLSALRRTIFLNNSFFSEVDFSIPSNFFLWKSKINRFSFVF